MDGDELAEAIAADAARPAPPPHPGWPARRRTPDEERARRRRARRWAWALSFAYLYVVAMAVLAGVRGGDGSGLEWVGAFVLGLPWSLVPTVPTVVGGGILNAALLHAFVRWAGTR